MTFATHLATHSSHESESAGPDDPIERSTALNDRLRLYDHISEIILIAQSDISQSLSNLFPSHIETGRLRDGTILRDGVEQMARRAAQLVEDVLDEIDQRTRTPDVVQKIREGFAGFLEGIEGELDRLAEKVARELECSSGPHGMIPPARKLWSEYRDCLIDTLEDGMAVIPGERNSGRCEVKGGGGEVGATSPPPGEPPAKPGFALVAEVVTSIPSSSMRDLVLEGQQVRHVQFGTQLAPGPDKAANADAPCEDPVDWCDIWADLISEICDGKVRPRGQADWRQAFENVCSRQQKQPDATTLTDWAELVWRKSITRRYVLSGVHKTICHEAETSEGQDKALEGFFAGFLLSSERATGLAGRHFDRGAVAPPTCELRSVEPSPLTRDEGQDAQSAPPAGGPRDLLPAIALSVPVVQIA